MTARGIHEYFPTHAHSEFSWLDGSGTVKEMVAKVSKLGQPGLALTDHGVMAGAISLYREAKQADLFPFPGEEFYLVKNVDDPDEREKRYHLTLMALNQKGFEALIKLSSRSHQRDRFHRKPLIDLADLAAMHDEGVTDGIALTTGCFFGLFQQSLVHKGKDAAASVAQMYSSWFPHTFIEFQHHNISDDDHDDSEIVRQCHEIAHDLGLPMLVGQDSHYCSKGDKHAHDMMKEICYFGDADDYKFPGDSFHLASSTWIRRHYTDEQWSDALDGHERLLDLHDLILPELDNYSMRVPKMSPIPDRQLLNHVDAGLSKRGGALFDHYEKRKDYELEIIAKMKMSNYFLLVEDVVKWCRDQGIVVNTRGSANGSLVCYALGISEVDPLEWNTDFERFLSLERDKPPDIDLDVESSRRQDVIDYLASKYPSMVQIGTYSKLGLHTEPDPDTGEMVNKGSLLVQYMAAKRRQGLFLDEVPEEDHDALYALSDMSVRKAAGTHASAFTLPGDGLPIDKYLAKMLIASSNTTVTQAPMDDVESVGYLKLDILGLRSLATVSNCLDMVGMDLEEIPWDDRKTCTLLRSGNKTAGVFQFEGGSTRRGAKEMKIKSTEDAIICMALYRPALMNGGQTEKYLANRESNTTEQISQVIDWITKDTFGIPVFQEQVLKIMQAAGLKFDEYNRVMKAVKASNDKIGEYALQTFEDTEPIFLKRACNKGMTIEEAREAWRVVCEFTDYGFNRAHAVSYGIMGYRSAYLKRHYPLEYMASLLMTWAGTDKEKMYVKEARRMKLPIIRPDVNRSDVLWTVDRSRKEPALRKGLLSIKSIGVAVANAIVTEREENGEYADMDDFVERLPGRPVSGGKAWKKDGVSGLNGAMRTLARAGALSSLGIKSSDMED